MPMTCSTTTHVARTFARCTVHPRTIVKFCHLECLLLSNKICHPAQGQSARRALCGSFGTPPDEGKVTCIIDTFLPPHFPSHLLLHCSYVPVVYHQHRPPTVCYLLPPRSGLINVPSSCPPPPSLFQAPLTMRGKPTSSSPRTTFASSLSSQGR